MLSKLKISYKVYLLGVIQLLLMLAVGGVSYTQMGKIGNELIDIAEQDIPLTNMVAVLTEHQLEISILFERSLLKASLHENNAPGAQQEFSQLKNDIEQLNKKTAKEFAAAIGFINQAIDKLHYEDAKLAYKELLNKLNASHKEYKKLMKAMNQVLDRTAQVKVASLSDEIKRVEEYKHLIDQSIVEVSHDILDLTLSAAKTAEEDEKIGIQIIGYLFVGALIIGAILPFLISKSISLPINELKNRLIEINQGDGDLTLTLDERGKSETAEVAKAFNLFLSTLQETIKNTNQQASDLEKSSGLAIEVMHTTLSNIEKQQMETEMVSSAVHEMSSSTADVANNAQSASVVTEGVRDKVLQGKEGAVETQKIIQRLAQEIDDAGKVIESLVSETNNIGNVLENIQGIAEQTNLLALNAAIEAARAGESGRGFAVVADEVRTLAQRTQTSTLDIQSLVGRLQEEAQNAVSSMQKGTSSASECLIKSDEASVIFEDAALAVNEISDLNVHIATASNQQSTVAEEINRNLINITQIANETTESAKKTSEVNGDIARRSVDLYSNLSKFKV